MPHLFLPLNEPLALGNYRRQLAKAHDEVARVAAGHSSGYDSIQGWACTTKRRHVDLSAISQDPELGDLIGARSQPFAEIVNQLATVERLLDALTWAGRVGATHVSECNPSTSRGPAGSCSHDLVVRSVDFTIVVEVSDVAGAGGNANKKMEKDLATLGRCTCESGSARRALAVSPQSAGWLQARPVGVSVAEEGNGDETWIFECT